MNWTEHFASRVSYIKPSTIREILKLTQKSDIISFAGGLPAPYLFPVERLKEASVKVLDEQGSQALQYGTTEGYTPLREWVSSRIPGTTVDHVQIVSGSQQGLDLIAKLLLNPGDRVLVTAPTYMGALRAFDAYEVDYVMVDVDDKGMIPASLEQALKENPKMIYAIPNFDNPTGICMSLERRQMLVNLAAKYNVPIYEDDPYGELRFEGDTLPSLYNLAPDIVIYAGTFSKIVVPGFRLGWLVADPELLTVVARAKQAADLHTATFVQMIAYEISKDGFMDEQIDRVRAYYKNQRGLMLKALEKNFPEDCHWTRPKGGMFLWVTLPKGSNSLEMLTEAVKHKVAYVPGEPFYAKGGGENTFRLSYSIATPEQIDEGMENLGKVIREHSKIEELV